MIMLNAFATVLLAAITLPAHAGSLSKVILCSESSRECVDQTGSRDCTQGFKYRFELTTERISSSPSLNNPFSGLKAVFTMYYPKGGSVMFWMFHNTRVEEVQNPANPMKPDFEFRGDSQFLPQEDIDSSPKTAFIPELLTRGQHAVGTIVLGNRFGFGSPIDEQFVRMDCSLE